MSKQPCTPDFVSCEQLTARFTSRICVLCQLWHKPTMVPWGRANPWVGVFPVGLYPGRAPGMQRASFTGLKIFSVGDRVADCKEMKK